MSNYQAASIKSGTRGSRKSTGSRSKRQQTVFVWSDPRYADSYPGNRLVVVSDTGADVTRLGFINPAAMGEWGLLIYSAPGKTLTLGQVYMAWLQGDYALRRHAEAMNLAMSRAQRRELKDYLRAEAVGLALDSWQRELVEITIGAKISHA